MQECLTNICKEFETCLNFLNDKSEDKTKTVEKLFYSFIDCFSSLKDEKLDYPKEFKTDVKYYVEGNEAILKKFEDADMKYLMLSDFYDYCRITKKYKVLV